MNVWRDFRQQKWLRQYSKCTAKQSITKTEVFNNITKTKEVLTIKCKERDGQETLKEQKWMPRVIPTKREYWQRTRTQGHKT